MRLKTSHGLIHIQARTKQTWEEAVRRDNPAKVHSFWSQEHLLAILRTDQHVSQIGSVQPLLQAVLQDVVTALKAQRGSIALVDEQQGTLQVQALVCTRPSLQGQTGFSSTLAMRCFLKGESMLCQDAQLDTDLKEAPSIIQGSMASIICALLRSPRQRLGVIHLDRGPTQVPFGEEDLYLADTIAARVSLGIECARLVAREQEQFLQTLNTLARIVEARDKYTGGHIQRVTDYALLLAEQLRVPPEEVQRIRMGTPLHDIGKIGIADAILLKNSRLTPEEYTEMKLHTLKGVNILEKFPPLRDVLPIVRNHHERWDGKGYPDGLAGEGIPRIARIVAVADAFDALTTNRSYRPGLPAAPAFAEIERNAGSQFDPACVAAFLAIRPFIETKLQYYLTQR